MNPHGGQHHGSMMGFNNSTPQPKTTFLQHIPTRYYDHHMHEVDSSGDEQDELPSKKPRQGVEVDEEEHTGLSPRMQSLLGGNNRKSLPSFIPPLPPPPHFFLEDGIETFYVDNPTDPRHSSVDGIYFTLNQRLERAATSFHLSLEDPSVINLKQKLAIRAAELEQNAFYSLNDYKDSVIRLQQWIQNATDAQLREVMLQEHRLELL